MVHIMKHVKLRKILVILSIGIFFLMLLAAIAFYFKILDKRYLIISLYANIIIQALVIILYILDRPDNTKNVRIMRYEFKNKIIRDDMFPEYMSSTNPRNPTIFKIHLESEQFIKDDHEFYADIVGINGKTIQDINSRIININSRIIKDVLIFDADIKMLPDEKINFKFREDMNIKIFTMEEMYTP